MAKHTSTTTIVSQNRAINNAWVGYGTGVQGWAGTDKDNYYTTAIEFRTPSFGSASSANISFSLWTVRGTSSTSKITLRYAICKSDSNKSLYTSTYSAVTESMDSYQISSGTVSFTDVQSATGSATYKTISVDTSKLLPSTTYYLFIWASSSRSSPGFVIFQGPSQYDETITITYYDPYKLSVSAGSGSKITVNRTSSGRGSTGNLSSGATLYHNDMLRISFQANANHKLLTSTVNGSSFTSGNTHTVSGDVSVAATAQPLASGIGATDANIESVSTITITRYNNAYLHTLTYKFGNLTGEIVSKSPSTSIAWTVPAKFYDQIPDTMSGVCTIICETFHNGKSLGKDECQITVTASIDRCAPIVSGTVSDINETTTALSGDPRIIIRYLSTAFCTISATPRNGATITSMTIDGNAVSASSPSVTYTEVEKTEFTFIATDSRGYTTSVIVKPIETIPYIKLTINPLFRRPSTTSGEIVLSFNGRFYNGNIGNYGNSLTIRYRYRDISEAAYGEWVTIDTSNYSTGLSSYSSYGEIAISDYSGNTTGFDYRKSYEFQMQAVDGTNNTVLSNVIMTVLVQQGIPVFDWGENDFNFNVQVKINEVSIFDIFYPVNSVYSSTADTMPSTLASIGVWDSLSTGIDGIYSWTRTA